MFSSSQNGYQTHILKNFWVVFNFKKCFFFISKSAHNVCLLCKFSFKIFDKKLVSTNRYNGSVLGLALKFGQFLKKISLKPHNYFSNQLIPSQKNPPLGLQSAAAPKIQSAAASKNGCF